MTNPDNIVRVRARNGGRASVYEANGWCQSFSAGLLEGNGVVQNTSADMNVLVGGSSSKPDVVIATNPAGYKVALDIVGQQAIAITAPASNSRISSIVAYTNDLAEQSTETEITGSPASCGLIVVNGASASSPVAPTDAQIRTAITSDGGTGSQASYCVIANITVASATTTIADSLIDIQKSEVTIRDAQIKSNNIDFTTFGDIETFMPGGNLPADYTYTIPDGYNLAFISIYIDTTNDASYEISINNIIIQFYTSVLQNVRNFISYPVKSGDTIKIKRVNGSGIAWAIGRIRKIF